MSKLDKIILNFVVFFLFSIIFASIVKNITAAFFISLLFSVVTNRVAIHLYNRFNKKKTISYAEMEKQIAIMGTAQTDFFIKATPTYFEPIKIDYGFYISLNCNPVAIFSNYKFSPCSLDDIAKFYRTAKDNDINDVWVLSKLNTRSTILFAKSLDINFNFISTKRVHKYLTRQNCLPLSIPLKKAKLKKSDFAEAIGNILVRQRAKYFVFSGISLGILAFFTPIKVYYIVVSIICLLLGIGCMLREKA